VATADARLERAKAEMAESMSVERERMNAEAASARAAVVEAEKRALELQTGVESAQGEIADLSAKLEACRKESWTKKLFKKEGDGDNPA